MASLINKSVRKFSNVRNVCIFGQDVGLVVYFRRHQKILSEISRNKVCLFSASPAKAACLYSTSSVHCPFYHQKQRFSDSWHRSSHFVNYIYLNSARYQSTSQNAGQDIITSIIPDPPPIPDPVPAIEASLQNVEASLQNVEASLSSLGLGGWTPVGLLQHSLEFLHLSFNMPWWLSIVVGTFVVKMCMLPLVIIAQRNAARLNNNLPQMQLLQLKMTEARNSGNAIDAARYGHELMRFMKEKDVNPFKNMIVPLAQAPVFISFFLALRKMANLPVESLKTGGIFWFTDLTLADPYYLLPLFTSATLFITIELGAEGGVRSDSLHLTRYVLRALPIIILPFIINFPATVLCYWATSNLITLGQVAMLRIDPVRAYFKIPKLVRHSETDLPLKKKGFIEGFKESLTNSKISKNLEDRARMDEVRFKQAGVGPIEKTYPYDPTKQRPAQVSASGKSRGTS